jgi:hypothetical protein
MIVLAAGGADFVHNAFVSRFFANNLSAFKIITFLAILTVVGLSYWWISQQLLNAWFVGRGRAFAVSLLTGFAAFFIVPRLESVITKRHKKR